MPDVALIGIDFLCFADRNMCQVLKQQKHNEITPSGARGRQGQAARRSKGRADQSRAGPSRADQSRAGQSRAGQRRASEGEGASAALPVLPFADRVARTCIFMSSVFPSMTGAGPANARNNHFGKTRRVSIISNWRDIIIPSVVTLVHSITPVENAQRSGFALQQAARHYGVLIAR